LREELFYKQIGLLVRLKLDGSQIFGWPYHSIKDMRKIHWR